MQAIQIEALEAKIKTLQELDSAADLVASLHGSCADYYTGAANTVRGKAEQAKKAQEKKNLNQDANNKDARAAEYNQKKDAALQAQAAAKEDITKAKKAIAELKVCKRVVLDSCLQLELQQVSAGFMLTAGIAAGLVLKMQQV